MKLWEYAILFVPSDSSDDKPVVIQGISTVLASTQDNALVLAARDIPEEYLDRLDEVEVVVRPF